MERKVDKNTKYYNNKKGILSRIYWNQVNHSKRRKHSLPSYTKEELGDWLFSQSNFNELYNNWVEGGYRKCKKPSVDRLDDYKPYSLDNIRLVTWEENNKKYQRDVKEGVNNKRNKTVYQYDLDGNFIEKFYSIEEVKRRFNLDKKSTSISKVCNGYQKSYIGYIWSFKKIHKKI